LGIEILVGETYGGRGAGGMEELDIG
jgi:hypothetical protein